MADLLRDLSESIDRTVEDVREKVETGASGVAGNIGSKVSDYSSTVGRQVTRRVDEATTAAGAAANGLMNSGTKRPRRPDQQRSEERLRNGDNVADDADEAGILDSAAEFMTFGPGKDGEWGAGDYARNALLAAGSLLAFGAVLRGVTIGFRVLKASVGAGRASTAILLTDSIATDVAEGDFEWTAEKLGGLVMTVPGKGLAKAVLRGPRAAQAVVVAVAGATGASWVWDGNPLSSFNIGPNLSVDSEGNLIKPQHNWMKAPNYAAVKAKAGDKEIKALGEGARKWLTAYALVLNELPGETQEELATQSDLRRELTNWSATFHIDAGDKNPYATKDFLWVKDVLNKRADNFAAQVGLYAAFASTIGRLPVVIQGDEENKDVVTTLNNMVTTFMKASPDGGKGGASHIAAVRDGREALLQGIGSIMDGRVVPEGAVDTESLLVRDVQNIRAKLKDLKAEFGSADRAMAILRAIRDINPDKLAAEIAKLRKHNIRL